MQIFMKVFFFAIMSMCFGLVLCDSSKNRLMDIYNEAFNRLAQNGEVKKLIDQYNLDYVTTVTESVKEKEETDQSEFRAPYDAEYIINECESDVLSKILKSKEVIVGAIRNKNWGSIGNYTLDEPTGFWPELMRMVWKEISLYYFKDKNAIKVTYKMFNNVFNALQLKNIDMTDNFFLFFNDQDYNNLLRKQKHISNGLSFISHTNKFILLNKHNIHDLKSFEKFINTRKSCKIGCLTEANCNTFKNKFHDRVKFVYDKYVSYESLIKSVENEQITAAVVSGLDMSILDPSKFSVIESSISTVHVPYFQANSYNINFNRLISTCVFALATIVSLL